MLRKNACVEVFEELLSVGSLEQWEKTAEELIRSLDFDFFLYGMRPIRHSDDYVVAGTYPPGWRDYYDAQGLARWDPTVSHCATRMIPLVWSPHLFRTQEMKKLYAEAGTFGLRTGVSIPLRGAGGEIGMISCASESAATTAWIKQLGNVLPDLQLLAAYMQESYSRLGTPAPEQQAPRLTHRELECLQWVAVGKTAWETAKIMCCSERTINFHVANVNAKLGVVNRRHAATRALTLGLITL
jgi:LuxR family quorum-sensing transcriptional regulator LasR